MANVRVALRVRPLSHRENAEDARVIVNGDEKIARIRNIKLDYKPESCGDTRERLLEFGFDYCYWSLDPEDPKYASQEVIFQDLGTTVLSEAIKGYNVCLFAYGQTGSGKTYTMMGTPASIGLTPRICEGLFNYNDGSPGAPSSSRIEVSFLEIYNERVRDLLHQSEQKKPYTLRVREHPEKGPYVQGLSQHVVTDYEQVIALLEQGIENRITAATHVHDASSRSHAIFTIQYTQAMLEDNLPSEIASKINLVDLAGSERASPNYCKDRITEGSNINRSLVTLGIVICALAQNSQMTSSCQSINSILSDGDSGIPSSPSGSSATGSKRQPFVPYRDSILTWLLKDSLGGNSKTIMIATVSPARSSYNETMSTLRYASNAKNIVNKPRVNEDANVKLIRELREEINRLKVMLRNFEMRTVSPSFSEERDGNLTELVLQNELKIEQLTKDWTDKWTDKAALMEHYNVDINKGKAMVTIDSGLPHLIAMDDDILSTGVVIYHLREGTTNIGSGDHDIVLQGENIQQEHCAIDNKFGVVELSPSPGAFCSVNGQEVSDVCRLSQGAIIVLGKSHRFRFNHPAEAAVLRQMRSDSQASFVNDSSLDWLDLSGDFSSSSKGNSLILNTRNSEPPSEEYQQGLREEEATYRKQIEEQQQYVEDLKSQIQAAQVKGEKELEHEQCLINQQIQEHQQWLTKEKERLSALCQQKRESSSQTESKTYVEVEVQNCVQTDIQPSLEEQEGKKLVQLELLRKCSLRRAERSIRRKRVKLQLERIVKKQKLLEAKKTLQQLQAACWLSEDTVKPTPLHVPKVQEPSVRSAALRRSSSSPGFSSYRRCSLPWTLQTLPNSYSAVLKRKCKSELAPTTKTDEIRNLLRSVSIDCLLNSSGSNGQLGSNPYLIGTKNLQFVEEQKIDLLIKQLGAGAALLSTDPQMSKKRQKMDKPRGGAKGSSTNFTAEQPKRRNIRATVSTGTKDTKLKSLKSPSPLTVGGPKKSIVQEKSNISPKSEVEKLPQQKSLKHTQTSPGQGKLPSGESVLKGKPARQSMASLKANTQRKPVVPTSKTSLSVDNISKMSHRRGENLTSDRSRISTERPNRVLLKTNIQTLGDNKKDHTDSSDSESFYSVDSLSSAYASALTEQLKQEELQRQRSNLRQQDSDSDDSQISQDSLAEKEKRKDKPNKRRFNKYKTIGATSTTTSSFTGDHNSFPLVTTGSVTTGLSKSFSLDSLADAEDVLEADSSEEIPAEIFWKLQSPRSLILNGEDQNKENIAAAKKHCDLDIGNSFYLKLNDGSAHDNCNVPLHDKTDYRPATLSDMGDGKSETFSPDCDSACISSGLSSQTDTLKPNGNVVHRGALSPTHAPILEAQSGEDDMNHLYTKDNVSQIEREPFPSQFEAPHITPVQHTCVHSVPHAETQDRPANICTRKGSETVEEANGHECSPPYCNLDKRCPVDLDSPCYCRNNSLNIQESLSDLTECKRRNSYLESEDNNATSLETPVTCTRNATFRKDIQGEDKTFDAKNLIAPISSININEVGQNPCSNDLCEIPPVGPMEIYESKEILNLPLTQGNLHLNNTTAKTIGENTYHAMPTSLPVHLENMNNQQQDISSSCQESVTSRPLCCESIQENPSMSNFKDDQPVQCDSNAIQMLSPSQRSAVERDINTNRDFPTKKQTKTVQETKLIDKEDTQCSIQKLDSCKLGNIFSVENTHSKPVYSTVDEKLPVLENRTPCESTSVPIPVQHSSLLQQKTISYCPTSQQGNVRGTYSQFESQDSVPDPCYDDTVIQVEPKQLAQSLCHKSDKTDVAVAPVTKPSKNLFSDDCITAVAEYNSLILHKNDEGLCFTIQNDGNLDETYHMAENSLSVESVAVRPSSQNPDKVICFSPSNSKELNRPDDGAHIKNYKEKELSPPNERTLPENSMFSKTDDESPYASATTSFICKPEGSPESQTTMETSNVFCPECISNKSQSNYKVLPKGHPKEIQHSHETNQTERAEDVIDTHGHLAAACGSFNQDLSTYDNTQSQILKKECPETSFQTYRSCPNENIAKLRKLKDINSNDEVLVLKHGNDIRSTKDLVFEREHWKFCSRPENSKELGYTAKGSSTGTPQERDAAASNGLSEGISGTGLPLPYYEAKMQNKPFWKVKCQTENLDQAMISDNMDGSVQMFATKQSALNISQSADAKSRFSFVMPKQYDGSQDSTDLNTSNISKDSYLHSSYESTDDTCSDDRTQEKDNLVQRNMCDYKNLLKTNEVEHEKSIRAACVYQKSAPCTTKEEYTNLKSKDPHHLSNNTSYNSSTCNVKSGTLQDATSENLIENVRPQDQDEDSEMSELFRDETYSGHMEDKMYPTTSCRSSSRDVSVDEVKREANTGMTADLSNCITNAKACEVECALKPVCDQNTPLLTHSSGVNDRVTCAVEDNDSSTSMGDKKSSGLEEKCLMTTGVCAEYSSDLSESTDISSSDTDTSRYLVLKNLTGLQNSLADALPECESCSPMSKENVYEISLSAHGNEEMSPCTDTSSPEHPNVLDEMDSTESDMNEFCIDLHAVSKTPSDVDTSPSRSNVDGKFIAEPFRSDMKSEVHAQHYVADHSTQTVQNQFSIDLPEVSKTPSDVDTSLSKSNVYGIFMVEHIHSDMKSEVHVQDNVADHSTQTVQSPYPATVSSIFLEDVGNKAYLTSKPPDEHLSILHPEPSHQAEESTDSVDNAEGLHFSSSDINPFVHSWQQEDSPKLGWKNCTFNSASDVSCAKFREQADKRIRCSSVDEGLNSHNSPFHSHLSSYANAKTVSSTLSSLGRNDSGPDITSLDDSQELLSDGSAVLCTGNREQFAGISGLQTKFEDYAQLDEIIFLYTSESETCNEPVKHSSGEQGTQIKHKHRKPSKYHRNHTDKSSSKQMRTRNVCQRPASWSNMQNMSLHLSQLLQETSELLGNLSKHNPENVSKDATKMQRDPKEQIMKKSVRDSSTQTSLDKSIQTESQPVTDTQNYTREHNHFLSSSGINVIVKVLGTDSLTHIPQNTLTENNKSKVTKTRTQSLPNLQEFESCKQSERVLHHSPQVRASTSFLTGLQDKPSTAFPYSSSKSSSVSTNVNKCAEDTVVNSPSSSVNDTTRYHLSYHEKTTLVDRASSPILTVKASKQVHDKLVPDNHLNNQNFAKILRNRKRKERELRDLQLSSSQTETDSESNAGNEYEVTRTSSLKEATRKRVSTTKFQKFVSEGCILRESSTNHSSSNSEITGSGKRCNGANYYTSTHQKKAPHSWEHLQSLQNLSLMSQPLTNRDGQVPRHCPKEFGSDKNDLGSFTITSGNSYIKNRSYPYSPSQMSSFALQLQEDGLSVVESECNTDILLGQDPAFRTSQKPHGYALQDLPMHNKFSNWSGVQCSATKNGMVNSSPDLNVRGSPTKTEASQEVLESRSLEIERLQRERAEVLSAIHLEMNPLPLTVQLAEAKLSYGIGETDALLKVLQTGKMDLQDTVSIKKQLYERHLKVIENLRKEREERLQICRRSRSLSPQKQLSASQTSLSSLRESDLPSRRREYLQQLRKDVVVNTRIQEPKNRAPQCPSEIEVMLKDYQKAREEAKTEIAKARDKLRERAEMERRRLQQGSLSKEDTKMKTLVSTSTLFTNSSLSLSSGPTSGYNSGMTATIQCSKLSSHETLPKNLDTALGSGRGRSAVRNCDLFTPTNISVPEPKKTSYTSAVESIPCTPKCYPLLQSSAVSYQELAPRVQASAMAEVMTACSYDIKKLYNRQASAGWIYQSTEKDVLVYYKAFSSPTKHGFIGAGVIKRPLHDVWCMVKDIGTRRLYDQSILTASVHERVSGNIQLVHVVTDTSLCYLKQPRDFCCMAVEFHQEKCSSLCFQSVYNESMPRPNKDTVRGELLPSAWILQPDTIHGEAVTRVIYMIQVDLGAPAIPSRLLGVISKRQPLVIAQMAGYLSR